MGGHINNSRLVVKQLRNHFEQGHITKKKLQSK